MEHTIETMIPREKVEARVKELAKEIKKDHDKENLILIGLLKGSVIFMSDLLKELDMPVLIDFMSVSSYGSGTSTTGVVKILKDTDFDVKDRNLLIVEDIIDSGLTLKYVKEFLINKGAKNVYICSMLDKPVRRKVDIKGDYIGFSIPDDFVVGYGLDYDQNYRNLPYIGKVVMKK